MKFETRLYYPISAPGNPMNYFGMVGVEIKWIKNKKYNTIMLVCDGNKSIKSVAKIVNNEIVRLTK